MGPALAAGSGATIAEPTLPLDAGPAGCPFHAIAPSPTEFGDWLEHGLLCTAGRREMKAGRYHVATVRNGGDYAAELTLFRREVAEMRKTGLLAICEFDGAPARFAEDELWRLGTLMREAGLTPSVAALISGETVEVKIDVACPVTGEDTVYSFFPVAFCQNAANPSDPLYDPSLSAPFTAINMTSDAFAFAVMVREQVVRLFDRPPAEVMSRAALEPVFRKCVTMWQNLSQSTILAYNRVAADPQRAVHLTEDRRFWIAPHNDPVFAELDKQQHAHEMPAIYARRLADKWLASLFEGEAWVPARDGQAGGMKASEGVSPGA